MTLRMLLAASAVLFSFGFLAALIRKNAIMMLIGIELMMGAANLNFIAFWRFSANPQALTGVMFVMFAIAVAAAEAAVGLAIVIMVYRQFKSIDTDQADRLKG